MTAPVTTSEQLLADMGWVRRLARAMVKDSALADDVAQETWLVAVEQQPETDRPLRPWLARVVGNLVRTRRRSEVRRDQRDAAFDDDRAVPTPADLIERVELQRAVADEVLALAEPYRTTILLHFVEGYSSAEIARRLAIPDGTVRRRLKVGIDQLREALRKRTDQPKRGWLAALVPFARSPKAAIGGILMKKLVAILLVLLVLLLIGAGVLWRHRGHDDAARTVARRPAATPQQHAAVSEEARTAIPSWMIQTGAPSRRIAGRVVARGKPVAGANVVLGLDVMFEATSVMVMPDAVSKVLQPIARVTSAADGTFDFGVQPAARFTVSASAADSSPASVAVDNVNPRSASDRLIVELGDCSSRLSGVVADASGGGIAKARLVVAGLSGAESDASGKYSLCVAARDGVGSPATQVRVEADGYGTVSHRIIVVGDLHHDFLLVPEAILVGRVTTSDGEPVVGARVIAGAQPRGAMQHIASVWTDSDREGRFRIEGLAPGTFELEATAAGLGSTSLSVIARPTSTSRELHLILQRKTRARVSGRVMRNGAPVSGRTVSAVQGTTPIGMVTSQVDGSFVFDDLPYGTTRFFAAPEQLDASRELEIARPLVEDVVVELTRAASVHGRVTRNGKPLASAEVMYMPAPQIRLYGRPPATRTDASGAFALDLPVGPGMLVAWDISSKAFADPKPIELAANEDKNVEIELDYAGEVRGIVVDDSAKPVAHVYVRLDLADGREDQCEAMTDAKGEFDCTMLAGGEYRATVTPSPGARQAFAPAAPFATIQVPRDGVVTGVRLAIKDERFAIRGTVVDDTGVPIPDVQIDAIANGPSSMDYPSTLSDASGRFEIANLARGNYDLHAHAADGSEGDTPKIPVGTTSASIKLARAGAVDGKLIGFSTTPMVFVSSFGGERGRGGIAIVDGASFSLGALPPGRYMVEADGGAQTDGQAVEVRPGETAHVDLRSRALGTVEGVIQKPIAGLRCDAKILMDGRTSPGPADASHQAFTNAAGRFVVKAPAGRVRIVCFSLDGALQTPLTGDVEVTSGRAATLTIKAP